MRGTDNDLRVSCRDRCLGIAPRVAVDGADADADD